MKWQEDKVLTGADPEFLKNFLEGREYGEKLLKDHFILHRKLVKLLKKLLNLIEQVVLKEEVGTRLIRGG